jgi:DeoR family transcriptional regulator, glycerol-3-phosphate regulon repressor
MGPDLTPNPRQQRVLDYVREHHHASVEMLAKNLVVTTQTVRRDLKLLTDAGLVGRYHGGVSLKSSTENIDYAERKALNREAKQRIAQCVASTVPEGASLIINIGTTTEEVARALLSHNGLRVVTNNLNVASILSGNPNCEVIIAGGSVRRGDLGIVGEATIDFIRQFRVDIGIIGISSIEADGTLRDYDYREVKTAQTIIAQSDQVWLVADKSKFQRRALVRLAHLSQVNALFTDARVTPEFTRVLSESGTRLYLADCMGRSRPSRRKTAKG